MSELRVPAPRRSSSTGASRGALCCTRLPPAKDACSYACAGTLARPDADPRTHACASKRPRARQGSRTVGSGVVGANVGDLVGSMSLSARTADRRLLDAGVEEPRRARVCKQSNSRRGGAAWCTNPCRDTVQQHVAPPGAAWFHERPAMDAAAQHSKHPLCTSSTGGGSHAHASASIPLSAGTSPTSALTSHSAATCRLVGLTPWRICARGPRPPCPRPSRPAPACLVRQNRPLLRLSTLSLHRWARPTLQPRWRPPSRSPA